MDLLRLNHEWTLICKLKCSSLICSFYLFQWMNVWQEQSKNHQSSNQINFIKKSELFCIKFQWDFCPGAYLHQSLWPEIFCLKKTSRDGGSRKNRQSKQERKRLHFSGFASLSNMNLYRRHLSYFAGDVWRPITVALHKGHEELFTVHGRSQRSIQEIWK